MDGVLQLDTLAAALTHESFEVDTKDREDHTFSGIMFDVACQSLPRGPLEYLEVQAVAVRGKLGPMTVWTAPGGHQGKHGAEAAAERWLRRAANAGSAAAQQALREVGGASGKSEL